MGCVKYTKNKCRSCEIKKGDYVVPVKKNHPNFNADLELYFDGLTQDQVIAGRLDSSYLSQEEKNTTVNKNALMNLQLINKFCFTLPLALTSMLMRCASLIFRRYIHV
ncbi:MAG: hypothetical protein J6B89_03255 [Bacilli bacterium]|nr:hypothetical protein [Bacilli bacterium]